MLDPNKDVNVKDLVRSIASAILKRQAARMVSFARQHPSTTEDVMKLAEMTTDDLIQRIDTLVDDLVQARYQSDIRCRPQVCEASVTFLEAELLEARDELKKRAGGCARGYAMAQRKKTS